MPVAVGYRPRGGDGDEARPFELVDGGIGIDEGPSALDNRGIAVERHDGRIYADDEVAVGEAHTGALVGQQLALYLHILGGARLGLRDSVGARGNAGQRGDAERAKQCESDQQWQELPAQTHAVDAQASPDTALLRRGIALAPRLFLFANHL